MLINPSFADLLINDTFTMAVNLTNFQDLYTFQVVLKYNGTILNMTSVTVPPDSVFTNHAVTGLIYRSGVDTVDHFNFTSVGGSLLGVDSVTVSNGTLFSMNFTVIGIGSTTVKIATNSSPVHLTGSSLYTYLVTYANAKMGSKVKFIDVGTQSCTVLSGVPNAQPLAALTVSVPPIDNKTNIVINENVPARVVSYQLAYEGIPVYFNASGSEAKTGNITRYMWNFGDGTRDNTTDSFISHVYTDVGVYYMNLTVEASGVGDTVGLTSDPKNAIILVGLVLQVYDWTPFIYTLSAIVGAVLVIIVARSALRRVRIRRAEKRQRMLTSGSTGKPPTALG